MTTVGGRRKYDLVGWSVVVLVVLEGGDGWFSMSDFWYDLVLFPVIVSLSLSLSLSVSVSVCLSVFFVLRNFDTFN
jgi:hypothetical protein